MLSRFDRDVLSKPGVGYLTLLIGINDIGNSARGTGPVVSAEDIITGYRQIVVRTHEHGVAGGHPDPDPDPRIRLRLPGGRSDAPDRQRMDSQQRRVGRGASSRGPRSSWVRAQVRTDGSAAYRSLSKLGYDHQRTVMLGSEVAAHVSMAGVHRVASMVKRWILGTHHGSVQPAHLDAYLDEFVFRFTAALRPRAACCFTGFCSKRWSQNR